MPRIMETEFRSLADHDEPHSVSILMPTHRAGTEIRQDPIRFKNLIRKGVEQLSRNGLREADAREKLEPLWTLVDDQPFWRRQSDGLAVYVEDRAHIYRLPLVLDETVMVGRHFYLKPLFPLVHGDSRFYILALGQKSVRFFEASRFGIRSVELEEAPENLAAAIRLDGPEPHVEFHTGSQERGPGKGRPAMYHGHGDGLDDSDKKKWVAEYCHRVDAAVYKKIGDQRVPLVLAAAEPMLSIYRQVNRYPGLDDHLLHGNYEQKSPKELHDSALEVVSDDFGAEHRAALARYQRAAGTDRVATDIESILRAAGNRQIDTLFLADDADCWGRLGDGQASIEIHDKPCPGSEDLLNAAALLTERGGGQTFVSPRRDVPGERDAVAMLRFSAAG